MNNRKGNFFEIDIKTKNMLETLLLRNHHLRESVFPFL